MDEPVSWQAIQLIVERLSGVTQAAGYRSDLGLGTVTDNPAVQSSGEAIHTTVDAGDFTEKPEASGRRSTVCDMDVGIESICPFAEGVNAALVAHRVRVDVLSALRDGAWRAASGIRSIEISTSKIVRAPDGADAVIVQVSARVGLAQSTTPAA